METNITSESTNQLVTVQPAEQVEPTKQSHIRTILQRDQYAERQSEQAKRLDPHRNSNGASEGLTIGLAQLTQFGVDVTALKHGDRLKFALIVPGFERLPLVQAHINAKGVYITGKVVTYHEQMCHLPADRIRMGDKRKGKEYQLLIDHIVWEQPVKLIDQKPEMITTGTNNSTVAENINAV